MGRERTWLRLGGALVALGLTAVGCSDADGEPTPTSGPTVSETPDSTSAGPRAAQRRAASSRSEPSEAIPDAIEADAPASSGWRTP